MIISTAISTVFRLKQIPVSQTTCQFTIFLFDFFVVFWGEEERVGRQAGGHGHVSSSGVVADGGCEVGFIVGDGADEPSCRALR